MRTIERTRQFKRDYKREAKGPYRKTPEVDFKDVISALAHDQPLAEKHRDHALTGDWKDHRDCHIKPDLILITESAALMCCSSSALALTANWNFKASSGKAETPLTYKLLITTNGGCVMARQPKNPFPSW